MSAYLCDNEIFRQLAAWLCATDRSTLDWLARMTECPGGDWKEQNEVATHIANILKKENARSLEYRYADAVETWHDLHDLVTPITLGEVTRMETADIGRIAAIADNYEYQACECPDFHESLAWQILGWIRKHALTRLPGHGEHKWGEPIEFTEPAPQVVSLMSMLR